MDEDEWRNGALPFARSTLLALLRILNNWLTTHAQKLAVVCFWLILLLGYQWYAWRNGLTAFEAVAQLLAFFEHGIYGPLLFIIIYALRPLVLFSATFLSVAAGFVFGPLAGLLYTIIGSNTSAMVGYVMGRYLGYGMVDVQRGGGMAQRYARRMRCHSFATVLTMRLMFLQYDLVSYLAGFLHINWKPFLLATVLGALPGSITFVLFGSSLEHFDAGMPEMHLWYILPLLAILLVGLLCSHMLGRHPDPDRD